MKTPTENSHTPWGPAQQVERLDDGIYFVSTASHGGIWLSESRRRKLPMNYKPWTGSQTWHEEDCDASMVAWFFDLKTIDQAQLEKTAQYLKGGTLSNWIALKTAKAHTTLHLPLD